MTAFAEMVAATNYSFLRGASHPAEMVGRAIELGMSGIGIADRNTVAGVVRAWAFIKKLKADPDYTMPEFRLVTGARLVFADGTPDIITYPANRHGWGRLTRLLTLGNRRAQKGDCILHLGDLIEHSDDLLMIAMAGESHEFMLRRLSREAPGRLWLGAAMTFHGSDRRHLARLRRLGRKAGLPLLATNDALYATPDQRPLHDILTCICEGTTVGEAGRKLRVNAERHLKAGGQMAELFHDCPGAVTETGKFLSRIDFDLEHLKYEYPHEPVPEGWKPLPYLHHLVKEAAVERYGLPLPAKVRKLIADEIRLIKRRKYAYYFLTVYDLVRYARSRQPPILCQGRGSAANSIVCFLLGVTSVDPMQHDLLFSRFVSAERDEPPDIDVDFEHERREEVIQHIYDRYKRERAGIAATVIHYRPRSALREVGKALGLTEDVTARLSSTIWGHWGDDVPDERVAEAGLDIANSDIARLKVLVDQLLKFPRHLSQHVGGFVLTAGRLDELVPIHNAAMEDRTFIEWDKDDIDALGLMKVDILALGMLTCIRKCFDLMREHGLGDKTLEIDLGSDDPAVYDMLCKGDSIGVFQVESRAQINMLPRLRPRIFYDLVVQVAIVRPGPIEGDMVHPYLRRRNGEEAVEFPEPAAPHDPNELRDVLGKTFGVPLFQEQAMRLAITAAGFTPEEANGLRRAMATFRNVGTIDNFGGKMIEGMVARGYERDFATRCFKQIEGFGSYGFPESHAQSFARLVYVSSWIKHYHPAIFTCALLNSQPMGFYAPAQLVRDAQEHEVEVRPIDVNASDWDNSIEPLSPSPSGEGLGWGLSTGPALSGQPPPPAPPLKGRGELTLRLGFRRIDGFREDWGHSIAHARADGVFTSIEQFARRTALPAAALRKLADADAWGSLGKGRREALWDVRRIPSDQLPLFAYADAAELGEEPDPALPAMPLSEEVVADYQTTRLSLKAHPVQFLRTALASEGVLSCAETNGLPDGRKVRTAGVVLIRQRPGKGNAVFITIEDETGVVNALLWARDMERQRRAVMSARLMLIEGEIQRSKEGVVHLMAKRITDRTPMLDRLSEQDELTPPMAHADEVNRPQPPNRHSHPRNVRVLPKSRDFH